jgi:aspartyl-tRNA(Asn)/glutamyl-tRNA(Gln) amidotransferase subunit A
MWHDLFAARAALASKATSLEAIWDESLAIARSPACHAVFRGEVVRPADAVTNSPLAGLPISTKDLFALKGQASAAGSLVLAHAAPEQADAPAVARLKAAGAAVMGRTHMVEFAFSGVGVNPHFGTPVNPLALAVDTHPRVPGGSSSGAAVSVASGAAFVGLGSDTGGSIRIPAALCGTVGFKPTARRVPTAGAVPLSTTLDTVCALTRSVRDAALVYEILSNSHHTPGCAPLAGYRLAMAKTLMLNDMDATVARAFERTLAILRRAGACIVDIDLPHIAELGSIQAKGGFSAVEALAWQRHSGLWPAKRAHYDPRVAQRVALGEPMLAADYIALIDARADWIARTEAALQGFDAVLSPTVPIVAPTIASVAPGEARDAEFFRVNGLLLRNTSVVNLLDGCAISLPMQAAGELPSGLMVWQGAMRDDTVLAVARQIEAAISSQ